MNLQSFHNCPCNLELSRVVSIHNSAHHKTLPEFFFFLRGSTLKVRTVYTTSYIPLNGRPSPDELPTALRSLLAIYVYLYRAFSLP